MKYWYAMFQDGTRQAQAWTVHADLCYTVAWIALLCSFFCLALDLQDRIAGLGVKPCTLLVSSADAAIRLA